jgi:hypothetical protein
MTYRKEFPPSWLWPDPADTRLVEQYDAGQSVSELAEMFDRSVEEIQYRLDLLAFRHVWGHDPDAFPNDAAERARNSGLQWTEAEDIRLVALFADHSEPELAARFGRSIRAIQFRLMYLAFIEVWDHEPEGLKIVVCGALRH